ncbi:MAG: cyclic nucleotide-binding domain-containing protein [Clostridia bacterium]|nr:cyclic nucleotide-binding domain-containing protein [Deltaproteobacteria bacterium]
MPHVDLLELPYFEGISIDALVSLVDLMLPMTFNPGDVILREGSGVPSTLYIATSGKVAITKHSPQGEERRFAELDGPTMFGEIELFCEIPAVATATAMTRVSAFGLTRETYDRLFAAGHPALMRFTFNVARVACHRLAITDEMMARAASSQDLVNIRKTVFTAMTSSRDWPSTTGAFKRL